MDKGSSRETEKQKSEGEHSPPKKPCEREDGSQSLTSGTSAAAQVKKKSPQKREEVFPSSSPRKRVLDKSRSPSPSGRSTPLLTVSELAEPTDLEQPTKKSPQKREEAFPSSSPRKRVLGGSRSPSPSSRVTPLSTVSEVAETSDLEEPTRKRPQEAQLSPPKLVTRRSRSPSPSSRAPQLPSIVELTEPAELTRQLEKKTEKVCDVPPSLSSQERALPESQSLTSSVVAVQPPPSVQILIIEPPRETIDASLSSSQQKLRPAELESRAGPSANTFSDWLSTKMKSPKKKEAHATDRSPSPQKREAETWPWNLGLGCSTVFSPCSPKKKKSTKETMPREKKTQVITVPPLAYRTLLDADVASPSSCTSILTASSDDSNTGSGFVSSVQQDNYDDTSAQSLISAAENIPSSFGTENIAESDDERRREVSIVISSPTEVLEEENMDLEEEK